MTAAIILLLLLVGLFVFGVLFVFVGIPVLAAISGYKVGFGITRSLLRR